MKYLESSIRKNASTVVQAEGGAVANGVIEHDIAWTGTQQRAGRRTLGVEGLCGPDQTTPSLRLVQGVCGSFDP
jgi:hypothetical protein